jgi:hypothetical protein
MQIVALQLSTSRLSRDSATPKGFSIIHDMTFEVFPEPIFLEKMKNVINKLEWEIGHCLRLGKGIEWGSQYGRPGLVEGATDELLEVSEHISRPGLCRRELIVPE